MSSLADDEEDEESSEVTNKKNGRCLFETCLFEIDYINYFINLF